MSSLGKSRWNSIKKQCVGCFMWSMACKYNGFFKTLYLHTVKTRLQDFKVLHFIVNANFCYSCCQGNGSFSVHSLNEYYLSITQYTGSWENCFQETHCITLSCARYVKLLTVTIFLIGIYNVLVSNIDTACKIHSA